MMEEEEGGEEGVMEEEGLTVEVVAKNGTTPLDPGLVKYFDRLLPDATA